MVEPLPPLDESQDPGTSRDPDTPGHSAAGSTGVGAGRHLVSVLLSMTFVPAAYVLLDYSSYRANVRVATEFDESMPTKVIVTMAIALGCLFVAAAAGRMSGLGPLVAGLVWGAALTAWVFFDFSSFAEALRDAPDSYDQFGFGLLASGFALFPATAGLLLGAAIAGRWRRPVSRF